MQKLVGIGGIPPAHAFPPGSRVTVSTGATDMSGLVAAPLFWLGVAFAGGFFLGRYNRKK